MHAEAIAALSELTTKKLREQYGRRAVRVAAEKRLEGLQAALAETVQDIADNDQVKVLLHAVEDAQSAQLKAKTEALVTFALQTIFERPLRFEVEFETRGTQTEAKFKVRDEHGVLASLRDAHGGGLLVVASFVMRVIVLLSIKPALRLFMVMDEPFVQVSSGYRDRLIKFLRSLADSAKLQLLIVTHMPELVAAGDRVYRCSLRDGLTQITEVSNAAG